MSNRLRLTIPRIQSFTCPENKKQAFLWDTTSPCLAIRATPNRKTFIFESRFDGKTVRTTLGDIASLTIDEARQRATEAKNLVDQGIDPRLEKRRRFEREKAERHENARQDMTLGAIWPIYMEERRKSWSDRYYNLHEKLITPGGQKRARAKSKTVPGPLASLADLPVSSITADIVKHWLNQEKISRPTQTRIAFEALRTLLNWC
ncbi:MAG: Arm DNA-binding domain-containing protein, partial [Desulforhopalus sp.]